MDELNGVTVYGVYQESLAKLKAGRGDYKDQVIVSQWNTGIRITGERAALKKELALRDKQIRTLTYCNDLNDSRVHGSVIMPGLKCYLEGLGEEFLAYSPEAD